ncbi:Zn(2)-C6 fungal-type domain-containing protein [Mycena chlorophos]|uniref:Zn(2)-C6 fungal-type domain-containing protein n=1 Tax=Mycena chlorophos TaxID=658473 RepID=A0A8H6TKN9_MYCCL|nr:Zn(2)-C6 fungal-type domain-containing protein [Mycena chlorophos]
MSDEDPADRELQVIALLRAETTPAPTPAAADGDLAEKYEQLVDAVTDARLAEAAKALVSGATFLVASAGIAALISTVQIGFFVAIGFPGCTPLDNSACTPSGQRTVYAILFFSFLGLCVDAVGGFFCVMKAGKLLSASNLAEDVLARKATLERRILRRKPGATRRRQVSPLPVPSSSSASLLATPQPDLLTQTTHLLAKVHTTAAHLRTHDNFHKNGSLFVLVGMTFFVVALMTQAIAALPRDWAVAFVVGVCVIGAGLVWMEGIASGVWVPALKGMGVRGRKERVSEMDRLEP